jgi:mRNA interferase HigB
LKNIIAFRTLKEHWEIPGRNDSEQALKSWYREAKKADWNTPNEIKRKYRNASIIGDNRVVFNICGNKYRLVVKVNYTAKFVFIRFIGTHKEYDQIDATKV